MAKPKLKTTNVEIKQPTRNIRLSEYAFETRFNLMAETGLPFETLSDLAYFYLAQKAGLNVEPPVISTSLANNKITPTLEKLLAGLKHAG